ncbi:hypothetical protein CCZ27_05165 [Thauera sinica]|nr:hypothetical protein CCZ27_05165 [Thauera sp. K11]
MLGAAMLAAACSTTPTGEATFAGVTQDDVAASGGTVAGIAGGALMARKLSYFKPEYIAGALVAYAIYDPLAPTWSIDVSRAGDERVRMDLRMKSLITGGEGEARQVFLRSAQRMAEAGGFAGYDVLRYEEGMESTRPFARRVASGEIRLVRSRQFPQL